MPQSPLLIGCASGFSGDRSDGAAAVVRTLAASGGGALIFETLAERTLALAQLARNGWSVASIPAEAKRKQTDEIDRVKKAWAALEWGALSLTRRKDRPRFTVYGAKPAR